MTTRARKAAWQGRSPAPARVSPARIAAQMPGRREVERVELLLPLPPSTNALYANAKGGGRVKTKAYTDWIAESGWRLLEQRPGRIVGRYEIAITIPRPAYAVRFDLGNREKAISDLLVSHGVITDDSLAHRMALEYGPVGSEVSVVLTRAA